jgi:hypothetical protein
MVLRASHRHYIFILATLAIASLGIVFDFDGAKRIAHYNPPNIAHYDLRYDVFPPSSRLFKVAFLDPIGKFADRDTVVLIGNSVIAGAGAKDKQFLNSSLSNTFNVINAGLGGELLGASSALAVLGMDANFRKHPTVVHHVFVAYPPSRIYEGGYWVTGHALTSLAKERNLSGYVHPYSMRWKKRVKQPVLGIKGGLAENLRCILDGSTVIRSIINRDFYCEKPFNTENASPGFLEKYANRNRRPFRQEQKIVASAMSDSTFIDNASRRNVKANAILAQLAPLERFLVQKGIPHKIHFLLLRDAPDAIDTLPRARQEAYDSGRTAFREFLAKRKPHWDVMDVPPMESGDFFDIGHMRESGQAKLSDLIKGAIARDQANYQRDQIARTSR